MNQPLPYLHWSWTRLSDTAVTNFCQDKFDTVTWKLLADPTYLTLVSDYILT